MIRLIFFILLLSFKSYSIEISLLDIKSDNSYRGVNSWSGIFNDLSGTKWDVSNFYTPKSDNFYLDTKFQIASEELYLGVVELGFDNKYDSDLFDVSDKISIETSNYFKLRDDLILNFYTKTVFGGRVSEKPCFDSFRREFHCGTGLAWSDYYSNDRKVKAEYNNIIGLFITKYF